ncbi:NMCC_0638 family (lipo)protein [Sphingomonas albertensis]|uniref:Uncharacterized protein n=1 Tax=Sphingomonas albertensis TaxID=2762591 RepID=A0ABR7ARS0_9SPHN|nr:hypothetical protein [Sphingomonas albertensis]MBC3943159.1 hypothetical protein [Sphingomonas albertensis]
MSILLALLTAATDSDARVMRMTEFYRDICLTRFPDHKSVAAMMAARGARELSQADVKVTMGKDPARAWDLNDGGATVWIEYPPFHACSVRWSASDVGNMDAYRAVADKYEDAIGEFSPIDPMEADQNDIHIRAVGEARTLPDKTQESLFFFEQSISDPKRRAAGETGFTLRFVHQYAPPEPTPQN